MMTIGGWTWKPSSPKKCVKAYLSNLVALKMNDAKAGYLYLVAVIEVIACRTPWTWPRT